MHDYFVSEEGTRPALTNIKILSAWSIRDGAVIDSMDHDQRLRVDDLVDDSVHAPMCRVHAGNFRCSRPSTRRGLSIRAPSMNSTIAAAVPSGRRASPRSAGPVTRRRYVACSLNGSDTSRQVPHRSHSRLQRGRTAIEEVVRSPRGPRAGRGCLRAMSVLPD